MKLHIDQVCVIVCILSVSNASVSIYSIQKRLNKLKGLKDNNYKVSYLDRYKESNREPIKERSFSEPKEEEESNRRLFISNILSQTHRHRPIVKTINRLAEEERLQDYLAETLMKDDQHRQLKHKRGYVYACRPERGLKTLKCPSDRSICLLDDMICNDYPDCPNGEDENPAVCLIHDWAARWFSKIQYYLIPTKK